MNDNNATEPLFDAADLADVAGLPVDAWTAIVHGLRSREFYQHGRYTGAALTLSEAIFEIICRLGIEGGLVPLAIKQVAPALPELWRDALAGDVRTIRVVVHDERRPGVLITFGLDAISRALARVRGDDAAVAASLEVLRDAVQRERADGTYALLKQMARPSRPARRSRTTRARA